MSNASGVYPMADATSRGMWRVPAIMPGAMSASIVEVDILETLPISRLTAKRRGQA